ncbi:MAG: hypothetical protein FWD51_00390 [Betaproteobacteria bacterium]|nr:hypothetical protein [Betaproteobacteria bacterium]
MRHQAQGVGDGHEAAQGVVGDLGTPAKGVNERRDLQGVRMLVFEHGLLARGVFHEGKTVLRVVVEAQPVARRVFALAQEEAARVAALCVRVAVCFYRAVRAVPLVAQRVCQPHEHRIVTPVGGKAPRGRVEILLAELARATARFVALDVLARACRVVNDVGQPAVSPLRPQVGVVEALGLVGFPLAVVEGKRHGRPLGGAVAQRGVRKRKAHQQHLHAGAHHPARVRA